MICFRHHWGRGWGRCGGRMWQGGGVVYGWLICRVAMTKKVTLRSSQESSLGWISAYFFSMCMVGYKARNGVVQCSYIHWERNGMEWLLIMSGPQQPDNLGGWWLSSCHSSVAGCIKPGGLSLIPSDCSRKYVIPKQNNNNKKDRRESTCAAMG